VRASGRCVPFPVSRAIVEVETTRDTDTGVEVGEQFGKHRLDIFANTVVICLEGAPIPHCFQERTGHYRPDPADRNISAFPDGRLKPASRLSTHRSSCGPKAKSALGLAKVARR